MTLHINHKAGGDQKHETVANISEHNTEFEREGDDSEDGGIYLAVSRGTVGVYDVLESASQLVKLVMLQECKTYVISLEPSGRGFCGRDDVENRRDEGSTSLSSLSQGELDLFDRLNRAPTLSDQTATTEIVVKEIHCVIDRFFAVYFLVPVRELHGNIGEEVVTLVPSSVDNHLDFLELAVNLIHQGSTFLRSFCENECAKRIRCIPGQGYKLAEKESQIFLILASSLSPYRCE